MIAKKDRPGEQEKQVEAALVSENLPSWHLVQSSMPSLSCKPVHQHPQRGEREEKCAQTSIQMRMWAMGWLWLVGSIKS